ncbi:hypothetical protein [Paenibacillus wulumuqiensis]|uniref:hypothetical protein n=1 Tax=Paenibacillus wulumuqiensis TaxID=1567107 RepID=UPI000619EBB9|nr:hypothetical protein [Paenibacillus wulumuqiensis]
MAIIPLKQAVIVSKSSGQTTGWGHAGPGVDVPYKVRASEQMKLVKNQFGEEAVSSLTLLFDKMPDIRYDDVISFTNELGETIRLKPIAIQPRRHLSGRVLITEVNL